MLELAQAVERSGEPTAIAMIISVNILALPILSASMSIAIRQARFATMRITWNFADQSTKAGGGVHARFSSVTSREETVLNSGIPLQKEESMRFSKHQIMVCVAWSFPVTTLVFGLFAYRSMSQVHQPLTPFTARYSEMSSNPQTGRTVHKQQLDWAVKSDGSVSRGSLEGRYGQRTILDFTAKREVTVSDALKIKTTHDYSYIAGNAHPRSQPSDCRPGGAITSLGMDLILGYKAYGYRRTTALAAEGRMDTDQWFSPDLNCWEIKLVAHKYNVDGTLTGLFEKNISEIVVGEPSDSLFDIPEEYAETKPSEREKTVLLQMVKDREGSERAANHKVPNSVSESWIARDEKYNAVTTKSWLPENDK
jgi:hypothetical protein